MTSPPRSIVFACNLNTIRSPMAEGLARKRGGLAVRAASCGVWEGGYLDPFMVQVMQEAGVDMGRHTPRTFEEVSDWGIDLLVTLTPESRDRAAPIARAEGVETVFWPAPDPTLAGDTRDARLEAYRSVRDALDTRVSALFARTM